MKCPNISCGRAIPDGATQHAFCGWGIKPVGATPNLVDQAHQAEARERAAAWKAEHGLRTTEDCRRFVRDQFRQFLRAGGLSKFELWCRGMKQGTVDWLVQDKISNPATEKVLRRLRRAGVVTEDNRVIPLAERTAAALKVATEDREVEAELRRVREAMQAAGVDQQQEARA